MENTFEKAVGLMQKQVAFRLVNKYGEHRDLIPGTKSYTKKQLRNEFDTFENLLGTPVIKVEEIAQ